MAGDVFQFAVDVLIGDVDVFGRSDTIDDQFGFDIVGGALLLAAAEGNPIDIYGPRIDALRCQGADHTLEAHVHLMLDERFGYREVVQLDDRG